VIKKTVIVLAPARQNVVRAGNFCIPGKNYDKTKADETVKKTTSKICEYE